MGETMIEFKKMLEEVNKENENNKLRIRDDYELYMIYNGKLRDQIAQMLRMEFVEDQTIKELQNRIVPINIIKKIVDKLATVYKSEPIRKPVTEDISDQEAVDAYSNWFDINCIMEFTNKMFKLNKHCLVTPYLDLEGYPRIRCLPSHTFSIFSQSRINPEKMDQVLVHIKTDNNLDAREQRYEYWDKDNYWIIDGEGNVVTEEMNMLNNPEGINPFKVLPFVHITQQQELLYPVRSSDIKSVQYAVALLLSDTALAQKYNSWGTLLVTGGNGEQKLKVGPGAIINLPFDPASGQTPDAKYLQPTLNSTEVLEFVEKLVAWLLTTNNLTPAQMTGEIQVGASGISKMLDQVESTEDIERQQKFFKEAEKKLWDIFAHDMLPYWLEKGIINKECTEKFSPEFEINILFPERKPMLSEKEKIENIKAKLDAGFMTMKAAIQELNPELEAGEVDDLILEIQNEKLDQIKFMERNMGGELGSQKFDGQSNEVANNNNQQ